MVDKIGFLQSVAIFAEIPVEAITEFADLLEEVEFAADTVIVLEGEWDNSVYLIIEGRARVHKGGRTLAELKRGDIFGEMAALDPKPRSASVTAIDNIRLFRLDQANLLKLHLHHPDIIQGFVRILSQKMRDNTHDMVEDYLYIQQVNQITSAAADVERGLYNPDALDDVAQRTDELGQLARVFRNMIREVHLREQLLRHEVHQLRIEIDESRRQQNVQEVVETDFFRELQEKARILRRNRKNV